jgi:hypothetical protein
LYASASTRNIAASSTVQHSRRGNGSVKSGVR